MVDRGPTFYDPRSSLSHREHSQQLYVAEHSDATLAAIGFYLRLIKVIIQSAELVGSTIHRGLHDRVVVGIFRNNRSNRAGMNQLRHPVEELYVFFYVSLTQPPT